MRRACLALLLMVTFLTSLISAAVPDYLIVPGVRVGSVTKDTSEAHLKKVFGSEYTADDDIEVTEGETYPSGVLFSEDRSKTVVLLWSDETRSHVKEVWIRNAGTVWKTENGITIGTPLKVIEQLNHGPVDFGPMNFDGKYGGTIYGCKGGSLKELEMEPEAGGAGIRTLELVVAPPQNPTVENMVIRFR